MRFMLALTASGALLATAHAQQDAVAPEGSGMEQPEEELSELERLSRTADDPYAGVVETRSREPVSVTLRALDKITARYTDLEIQMNQIARFGSLEIIPRTCDKRPPEEFPETTAFLEVFDTEFGHRESDLKIVEPVAIEEEIEATELEVLPVEPVAGLPTQTEERLPPPREMPPAPEVLEGPQAEGVNIFRGWMFASSPALNALEHPVYDVWVIDCTTRATGE